MKVKLISMLLLLLLLPTITIANATPKGTAPFYYIGTNIVVDAAWQHTADDNQYIMKYTETADLTTDGYVHAGTIMFDVVLIAKMDTGKATAFGKFVINLDSGEKIEGTMSGKINIYANQPDIKFVGHGDIHVQGILSGSQLGGFILDGYSW
jgi:hypothetical protein